jgi:hypothetical protein
MSDHKKMFAVLMGVTGAAFCLVLALIDRDGLSNLLVAAVVVLAAIFLALWYGYERGP